jgi:hypothetical protein
VEVASLLRKLVGIPPQQRKDLPNKPETLAKILKQKMVKNSKLIDTHHKDTREPMKIATPTKKK